MYAQGILYFSLLNLVGLPSLSHTHMVFQAGCCKGCSRLAKVTLPAKLGGWMRSRAPWGSCPGPLGGSQAAPPPGTICASGAWPRRRVFPGKANLVPSSKGMK